MSAYFASLASLCLSLVAKVFALVDDLATRIPPSCCLVCQINNLRESHLKTVNKKAVLVFTPSTEVHYLKKLEHIDVEKALYRNLLPTSAQPAKTHRPSESKILARVHFSDAQTIRKPTHQHWPVVDGFYIMPERAWTQTTISPYVASSSTQATTPPSSLTHAPSSSHSYAYAHAPAVTVFQQQYPRGHQLQPAVELPAPQQPPHPQQQPIRTPQRPIELPAHEVSPLLLPQTLPLPVLPIPRPRSSSARKASPLLAPPPVGIGAKELRGSCESSLAGETIQIGFYAELLG